ncbi:MAG TPA: putative glycoside hydrolase, partial [Acidimicrobiia bacterium]|nr:putative glycoside hydrolase [Acidimicrobiia bacterium]
MRRLAGLAVVAVLAGCQALPVVETTSTIATTPSTTTITSSTTTTTLPPVVATGRVVDGGGRPIPGVSVAFGESITTTGADGGFEVEASRAGPIVLTKAGLTTVEARWSGAPLEQVMSPSTIRGIRVGAGAAGSDEHFRRLIDLATVTSVNAFVFDTKQEGGQVLYDTRVQQAHDIGAVDVWYDAA